MTFRDMQYQIQCEWAREARAKGWRQRLADKKRAIELLNQAWAMYCASK